MLVNRRNILKLLGLTAIAAALPATSKEARGVDLTFPDGADGFGQPAPPFSNAIGSIIDYPANTIESFPVRYQLVKVERPYRRFKIHRGSPVFWKDAENFIVTPKVPEDLSPSLIAGVFLNDYDLPGSLHWIQVKGDRSYVRDVSAIEEEKARLIKLNRLH